MAPDINSLPASPRLGRASQTNSQPASVNGSRRTSQVMGPPPPPPHAVATQTSNTTSNPSPNTARSPVMSTDEQSGLPLRHPRPLTAAELYLECEKEQEAVVNRLTRELTALRAQSASVASNASHSSTSTSASLLPIDISDPNPTHQMTGSTHPTPSRRHRSSSSVSNRSAHNPSASGVPTSGGPGGSMPLGTVSQASADRAAAAGGVNGSSSSSTGAAGAPSSLSRQPSTSALGGSSASASARASLDLARHPHYRPSISREPSLSSTATSTAAHAGSGPVLPSPAASVASAMQHYADTTAYRSEMEIVKAENEALRQRVRALERALRTQQQQQQPQGSTSGSGVGGGGHRRRDSSQSDLSTRQTARAEVPDGAGGTAAASAGMRGSPATTLSSPIGPMGGALSPSLSAGGVSGVAAWAANDGGIGGVAGPRERSESQSTTASSRPGLGVAADDEVRVGESASSGGVGRSV